jgi:hypothetical protein
MVQWQHPHLQTQPTISQLRVAQQIKQVLSFVNLFMYLIGTKRGPQLTSIFCALNAVIHSECNPFLAMAQVVTKMYVPELNSRFLMS